MTLEIYAKVCIVYLILICLIKYHTHWSIKWMKQFSKKNRNINTLYTTYTLFSQTRKWQPSHSGITVSSGMEEMPSLNTLVQRLKVAILPLDLPCSGPITHLGEILTTGKSHRKKPDKETSEYVRPERVNKWPNSITDIRWWWYTT